MPRKKKPAAIEQDYTCQNSSCGLVFSQPLKVKNLCGGDSEIYDACPRCLTAVSTEMTPVVIETEPTVQVMEVTEKEAEEEIGTVVAEVIEGKSDERVEEVKETEVVEEAPSSCAHYFGFLSERAKNEPIPDDCVMCENLVKCMLKKMRN